MKTYDIVMVHKGKIPFIVELSQHVNLTAAQAYYIARHHPNLAPIVRDEWKEDEIRMGQPEDDKFEEIVDLFVEQPIAWELNHPLWFEMAIIEHGTLDQVRAGKTALGEYLGY